MILRSSLVVALLGALYFFRPGQPRLPLNDREALILEGLMQNIEYIHMSPKAVDDAFSKHVFKTFTERMDGGKRYFTQKEINELKKYENLIDDQVNARSYEFFNAALPVLDNGISRAQRFFTEIIDAPIPFDLAGYLETDAEKRPYAKDEQELKAQWKTNIHFEVMTRWLETVKDQKGMANQQEVKTDEVLKTEAIQEIKKRYTDFFDRMSKLRRSDRLEMYLGSIANYFDPHTDYFSPKEKQDFDINMGNKLEGIGARLQTEGEYTKIFSIVVGGPAWKTKKLEDNDIILKVAQEGQPAVDITGMRVDDVVQLVRGKKGTTVILTVRKKDNSVVDIAIERDQVQLEDSKAKSVILSMPGKIQNIGYINLPKFYSSFESDGGNSCAVDVAEEVRKLKSQDVNGIILDLRNNSGGSLNDVVDMSGLFIEDGPIVQVKGKEEKPYLHIDKDKSVLYSGPFIILVNQFSASASEIIAAAMQDYNRAIIVGSRSTFGKGTVQRFYDLDRGIRGFDEFKPLGNVKMTVQKFYRVNGGSTQLKGVIPDIVLPDTYHYIETGEKEYDNPMAWTEIVPVPYSQKVVELNEKDKLIVQSKSRVEKSTDFKLMLESASHLKATRDQSKYPLSLAEYRKFQEKRELENKKFEKLMDKEIAGFQIDNLRADLAKINIDESSQARNDEFIKGLKKDIYLEEALFIMRDMINLEKSFANLQPKILQPGN